MDSRLQEVTGRMLIAMKQLIAKGQVKDAAEFAKIIGTTKERISLWKTGKGNATVDNMLDAYYKLGVSFQWLGTGEGEMFLNTESRLKQLELRLHMLEKKLSR